MQWNLTHLYENDYDPRIAEERIAFENAVNEFVAQRKTNQDYLKNPVVLRQALDQYDALIEQFGPGGKENYYFWLKQTVFSEDATFKARLNQSEEFAVSMTAKKKFFELSLGKIDSETQEKMLANELLREYRHFLERIFQQARFMLSEPEEKIISLMSKTAFGNWASLTEDLVSKETREVMMPDGTMKFQTGEELSSLLSHPDKKIRSGAADALQSIVDRYTDVAVAEMNSLMEYTKQQDDVRGFLRPDESRHLDDDIESNVVDTLLEAVQKRYTLSHRYYAFKKKLLGLQELLYSERNLGYGTMQQTFSYDEAKKIVSEAFRQLDPEFSSIFEVFCERGQIDVLPQKGKKGGAFCASITKQMPIYVMLNYTSLVRDVTVIAHEMGHAINHHFLFQHEKTIHSSTSLATAEVASTLMEDVVLQYLVKNYPGDEMKLGLLIKKLDDCVASIQRQVAAYSFEQAIHNTFRVTGYVSKETMGKLFHNHMTAYLGEAVTFLPGDQRKRVLRTHFRRPFYVYSYASGLLISMALQKKVKENPVFIAEVKKLLSTGLSVSPREAFLRAGINITERSFRETGLDQMENLLDQAERLAEKILH